MKTYILKLKTTSTTNYNLYDGTTLVSDSDLATLFGSAGSAYFTFDFNEGTPTNTTSLTILNSEDTAVMTNTGLEGITEDRNFKGVWADSATAFTSFTLLKGVAMDEAELTTLVGMVKNAGGIKTLTTADYNYPTNNPTYIAIWLLEEGVYKLAPNTEARFGTATGFKVKANSSFIVTGTDGTYVYAIVLPDGAIPGSNVYGQAVAKIYKLSGSLYDASTLSVVADLNNTSTTVSLSASAGKGLNDKIEGRLKTNAGAPTTSTAGTKGQLLEDTTNGNLYICTNSASPYAWKQIDKDEILTNAGAPTTSTAGTLGQLLTDTTNAKLYQLTAIDTTDPQNPSYTWSEVGGSSGPTVVQTTGTSTTDVMSQNATSKMAFPFPANKGIVCISNRTPDSGYSNTIRIGSASNNSDLLTGNGSVAVGGEIGNMSNYQYATGIGYSAYAKATGAVALGSYSQANVQGEMNIGSTNTSYGYNSSNYRLLTGVYDPQTAHDAATKGYVDGTTETLTIADTDWSALSSSDPYTYSATVSVTATIGANSTVSLINDSAVDFATYGFAIGSVDQPNNTVTVYSIGSPSSSVNLKINVKGA